MIDYFGDVYWANLMFCNAVQCGASLGDVDDANRAARALLDAGKASSSPEFKHTLIEGYVRVAQRLERLGAQDESAGRRMSAGEKMLRVTALYATAEVLMDDYFDPAKAAMFEKARAAFRKALPLAGAPHSEAQFISVPFEGKELEGLFVPARGMRGASPAVVHLNGGHSCMYWPYLTGITESLARRGIASLTFDHPGSGTARYHLGFSYRIDSESFASAAVDVLAQRGDVDKARIAVAGASLGGYYAPRAAAFEKRFKACLVLAAYYEPSLVNYFGDLPPQFTAAGMLSAPDVERAEYLRQARWRWGVESDRALLEKLQRFSLNGVAEKIRCPLLIIHGDDDVQIPLVNAERTIREAVHSPNAELVVLGAGEGNQHCALDNMPLANDLMADWAAEVLGGKAHRTAV